jgi:endonuclease YncB( thermonuclease family)
MIVLPFLAGLAALTGCTATDGDSLNCNGERIRLLGIDAPEFKCPRNRSCVAGDPRAAKDHLAKMIHGRRLTITRIGKDRYNRSLAVVYADGLNLSCQMVRAGRAVYVAKWDNGERVAKDCGLAE